MTVIDTLADYRTRDGSRVTIHTLASHGTFAAKGSVWRMFRGRVRPHGFYTWNPENGKRYPLTPSPKDIVAKWD